MRLLQCAFVTNNVLMNRGAWPRGQLIHPLVPSSSRSGSAYTVAQALLFRSRISAPGTTMPFFLVLAGEGVNTVSNLGHRDPRSLDSSVNPPSRIPLVHTVAQFGVTGTRSSMFHLSPNSTDSAKPRPYMGQRWLIWAKSLSNWGTSTNLRLSLQHLPTIGQIWPTSTRLRSNSAKFG